MDPRNHLAARFRLLVAPLAIAPALGAAALFALQAPPPGPPAAAAEPPATAAPAASATTPTVGAAQNPPPGAFFESIDVNVVNVDVFVTDKKGNLVSGLKREDFEILEDKKPVQITNFYAVADGKSQAPVAAPPAATAPSAAPSPPPLPGASALDVPEEQRLHMVVYVDNYNLRPFDRNRVFVAIRQFLNNQLSRGDRVMLVTFDRSFHVRRPFTSDPTMISNALFEIEKMSAQGVHLDSDRRDLLSEIKDAKDANEIMPRVRSYAESLVNDMSFTVAAIKDLVGSLAGLPGRKAILYVSDGLQMVPGEDIYQAVQEKFNDTSVLLDARSHDMSSRFQELIASANSSRVSFYTIDAGGLRVASSASAENQQPGASTLVDSVYFNGLQDSIRMMAEETGGKAIYNTNNVAPALERVAQDFKNYYSLGYTPAHVGDGRYHKVDVRLKRKDLVVRHREGYRDKSTESRMSDGVLSSLYFDVESNPLGIALDRGQETRREDGYYVVPVNIRIPIGRLVTIPSDEAQEARVRVFLAAMDEDGGTSEVQQAQVPIRIPQADAKQAQEKVWVYTVPLVMRAGPQRLAVGVRDDLASQNSFTVKTIRVGTR